MYFITFWYGKCQTGSVVTVQSQFERGTIKIKFLVFCLKGVIPLNKGNNKITELRAILQRKSQNS
jgi:hypothetical protein